MKIKIIGTGSAGNSYALLFGDEILLIEAGMKLIDVKKAIDFDISKVVGCLITHEHGDHAKHIKEYLKAGIKCYSTMQTFKKLGVLYNHFCEEILTDLKYKIGSFEFMAFKVNHDAVEPVNFIINHKDFGKILFVTDTNNVPYIFKDVRCYLIEANFSEAKLEQKFINSENGKFVNTRVFNSHLSIEGCENYLSLCDLSRCEKIILTHLSYTQSNATEFKRVIENRFNKVVEVAENGKEYLFF